MVALFATTTAGTLTIPSAYAETPVTAQARADKGAWLPYAPPPQTRAGLCLVDTGVNVNPDTESSVVERTSIDGGPGDDASTGLHGTILAMLAAAPANEWGTIGTAPGAVQIVSVRVLEPGQTAFPLSAYAGGITLCLQLRAQYNIRVINLSLGSPSSPTSQELATSTNAIQRANDYGIAVVAAAGNDDGGPLEYPAADPAVLSVGAIDTTDGLFCAFSNRGEGLRMTAPGCDLDAADPTTGTPNYNFTQGTSEASEINSTALAALIDYRPDLSYRAAEEDLTNANGGQLDIAAAFRQEGLAPTVAAGEAVERTREQTPPQTPTSPITAGVVAPSNTMTSPGLTPTSPSAALPRPQGRLQRAGKRLLLTLTRPPGGTRVQICLLGHPRHSRRLALLGALSSTLARITIPDPGISELKVRYTDPHDTARNSPWTSLRPPPPPRHAFQGLP